jgi:hypothetical protein
LAQSYLRLQDSVSVSHPRSIATHFANCAQNAYVLLL